MNESNSEQKKKEIDYSVHGLLAKPQLKGTARKRATNPRGGGLNMFGKASLQVGYDTRGNVEPGGATS